MKRIYLIRHAKAWRRLAWEGSDASRPLSPVGLRQAAALVRTLAGEPIERVVSSPHRRCRKTVEPLAAARGLCVDLDERLAEGQGPERALDLVETLGNAATALCGHGDQIPALLAELERRGLTIEDRSRCGKGSVWILQGPDWSRARARYRAPSSVRSRRGSRSGADPNQSIRLGVLDMGSTSFHLLVADATPRGEIRRVDRDRVMLRLGAVVANEPRMSEATCARVVGTVRRLRRIADDHGAEILLPVATAALRQAENGGALAERIGAAIGAPVRLLSGEEEARLIFAAFRHRGDLKPGPNLGIDLGGGSLELAVGDAHGISWETTLPLGVARLHGELVGADPMKEDEVRAVRERVERLLAPHRAKIRASAAVGCTGTGGSVRALARLLASTGAEGPDPEIDGLELSRSALAELAGLLTRSTHAERLGMPGMAKQRADLLPVATLILVSLLDALDMGSLVVSEWGLREGVILETLGLAGSDGGEAPLQALRGTG